jgi:hypothetical protein
MANTDSFVTVAQYLQTLLNTNKATWGVVDVWYGDQSKLPHVPAICVEPGGKTRALEGGWQMTKNDITAYVIVYVAKLQDEQTTRLQTDQIAEQVEAFVHLDLQLNGLLVQGYFTGMESGYTYRSGTLYRACRMTYSGMSKTMLHP